LDIPRWTGQFVISVSIWKMRSQSQRALKSEMPGRWQRRPKAAVRPVVRCSSAEAESGRSIGTAVSLPRRRLRGQIDQTRLSRMPDLRHVASSLCAKSCPMQCNMKAPQAAIQHHMIVCQRWPTFILPVAQPFASERPSCVRFNCARYSAPCAAVSCLICRARSMIDVDDFDIRLPM
jgi:hypothetical protein